MKVLIIGGTGVISTAIVEKLAARGMDVTVFNRGLRPVRYTADVTVLTGDKKNRAEFFETMKNATKDRAFDAVIDMISYNFEDAKLTLDAFGSGDSGSGPHYVFTSTCATYKRPVRVAGITEENARWEDDSFCPYGYHKARMEDFLLERHTQNGTKVTIIRPSLTYGIGSKNVGVLRNNYGIIERIKRGKEIIVFGDGTNPWDFTFAPDLAQAYAGVLGRENCCGQIYHATSGDIRIWDDLYVEFGKIVGAKPKLLHISTEMLRKTEPPGTNMFLHIEQEKMHSGIVDNSKIKRDVPEYAPEYTLDKTLRALYDWYMRDESARAIDPELERLEDELAARYHRWA